MLFRSALLAERAFRSGEADTCRWWTEVCHKLDRKLALDLKRRMTLQDVG